MKAVFAGTPDFARAALEAMLATGLEVPAVLTQPDRPAGRGMKLQASPVKQAAQARGLQVLQPRSLRMDGKYPDDARDAQHALDALGPDVMVVAAYGLILPEWVLALPRLGCINIHASLLPRWRGAAPIHRAIEAGDTHTGITIMQMDAGLDTGDMLLVAQEAIGPRDTTAASAALVPTSGKAAPIRGAAKRSASARNTLRISLLRSIILLLPLRLWPRGNRNPWLPQLTPSKLLLEFLPRARRNGPLRYQKIGARAFAQHRGKPG